MRKFDDKLVARVLELLQATVAGTQTQSFSQLAITFKEENISQKITYDTFAVVYESHVISDQESTRKVPEQIETSFEDALDRICGWGGGRIWPTYLGDC